MTRGEIWTVAGGGDYTGKPRPVVILQDDRFDATDSITVCAFATDPTDAPLFRILVEPNELNGLAEVPTAEGDRELPKTMRWRMVTGAFPRGLRRSWLRKYNAPGAGRVTLQLRPDRNDSTLQKMRCTTMAQTEEAGNGRGTADWSDFVHTGSGTLAGRYLRMFWHPVFRSADLRSGKAAAIRIMNEELTLYRGQGGTIHALAFRCAHRGTQLSTGWVEGDNIRCRYHGWTYDPSGQCVQQPAEPQPFCEKVRIRAYPTQEYLGFVFLYMGEGQPPPLRRYPELEGEGELEVSLHTRGCNYFNNMDNAVDELHHFFVHWNRRLPVAEQAVPRIGAEETDYGLRISLTRPDEPPGWVWHFCMPTTLHMNMTGGYQSLHWRVPIDDESHLIPTTTLVPPGAERRRGEPPGEDDPVEISHEISEAGRAIRAGKMTIDDIDLARAYFPIGDDVTQLGQGAIADREHERLGASDVGVILLRNLWKRELRSLAEGRPLREWKHATEPLLATARFG